MNVITTSFAANAGGNSQKIVLAPGVSAPSTVLAGTSVLVTPDTNCFYRIGQGAPTALADGTDQILLANNTYRIAVGPGYKLAFISPNSGSVYITPEA